MSEPVGDLSRHILVSFPDDPWRIWRQTPSQNYPNRTPETPQKKLHPANNASKPIQTTQASNSAVKKTTQPTEKKQFSTSSSDAEQWHTLFNQLNLTGAARALAKQCKVKKLTNSEIHLLLDEKHAAFLQDQHVKKIRDAIQGSWNKDTHVTISLQHSKNPDHASPNPADIDKLKQQQKLIEAEQRILNDEKVQRIMQTFDAQVVKDSIIPINDK